MGDLVAFALQTDRDRQTDVLTLISVVVDDKRGITIFMVVAKFVKYCIFDSTTLSWTRVQKRRSTRLATVDWSVEWRGRDRVGMVVVVVAVDSIQCLAFLYRPASYLIRRRGKTCQRDQTVQFPS